MQYEDVVGKMNPKVKKAWLKALRSGEYKQGRSALVDKDNNFCCLGVLCNLHAEANPGMEGAYYDEDRFYMDEAGHLPSAVADWAGLNLSQDNVRIPVNLPFSFRATSKINGKRQSFSATGDSRWSDGEEYEPWTLVDLNDAGANFKQIADVIEHSL